VSLDGEVKAARKRTGLDGADALDDRRTRGVPLKQSLESLAVCATGRSTSIDAQG
jgi:hypothetical protein